MEVDNLMWRLYFKVPSLSSVQLLSCVRLFVTPWTIAYQTPLSMEFSRQEYWSGLPFSSLGIFPTQGSNPDLLHCRWMLYYLRHLETWYTQKFKRATLMLSVLCCCCSVAQLCLTLRDRMGCSTPGFPVLHHLLKLAQTHVHWVRNAIQPSHLLSSRSPPAFNLSQHQGLF